MTSLDPSRGACYEAEHVHAVYEQIASHFSLTRHKVCVAPYQSKPPSPVVYG